MTALHPPVRCLLPGVDQTSDTVRGPGNFVCYVVDKRTYIKFLAILLTILTEHPEFNCLVRRTKPTRLTIGRRQFSGNPVEGLWDGSF